MNVWIFSSTKNSVLNKQRKQLLKNIYTNMTVIETLYSESWRVITEQNMILNHETFSFSSQYNLFQNPLKQQLLFTGRKPMQ